MGNAFNCIRERVGEIIHGVDWPVIAGAIVVGMANAIEQRVAHLHVGRGHVPLGAQHMGAVGKFTGAHPLEEVEIFFDRAAAVGAMTARFRHRAAIVADLLFVEAIDIGFVVAN